MADSIRYKIYSAIKTALKTITISNGYKTNVASVSDELTMKHPETLDAKLFPALFIQDTDEVKLQFDIGNNETISRLLFIVQCMIYTPSGVTSLARSNLMRDVEKCIINCAALNNLIIESANPTSTITSKGEFGSYCVWDQHFEIQMKYTASDGG